MSTQAIHDQGELKSVVLGGLAKMHELLTDAEKGIQLLTRMSALTVEEKREYAKVEKEVNDLQDAIEDLFD